MLVLEARDLYKFYHTGDDEVLALRGVSLTVSRGETVAVLGPSGSGKSTLLACLAGLDEPDGGHVRILGQSLTRRSQGESSSLRARCIGVMLQSENLFDGLSVQDSIRLAMQIARRRDEQRVIELLEAVALWEKRRALVDTLSGGEAARAALAVALSADPALILADEPTGEVDAQTEQRLLDLLDRRRAGGGATVVATHSNALASRADAIVRLSDGRVVDG